jgi:hypothetical protein
MESLSLMTAVLKSENALTRRFSCDLRHLGFVGQVVSICCCKVKERINSLSEEDLNHWRKIDPCHQYWRTDEHELNGLTHWRLVNMRGSYKLAEIQKANILWREKVWTSGQWAVGMHGGKCWTLYVRRLLRNRVAPHSIPECISECGIQPMDLGGRTVFVDSSGRYWVRRIWIWIRRTVMNWRCTSRLWSGIGHKGYCASVEVLEIPECGVDWSVKKKFLIAEYSSNVMEITVGDDLGSF